MSDEPIQAQAGEKSVQLVTITDIHMPFLSMVVFMVKWAIAAIPAIILLSVIYLALVGSIMGIFSSFRH